MPSGAHASSPDVSAFRRVRDISVDLGWPRSLMIAPRWLVCRRYLGLVADLRELDLDRPLPPEMRVTTLCTSDVPALGALNRELTREAVTRRLDEGQQCTLGWWGGELAHARWESTVPVYLPYLGRTLRPGPGDQVVVDIYTSAAFRGRGIAGTVMTDASRRARAAGVSRLVWLAAWWNRRSLGLARQFASRAEGVVGYWALGPWRRYFVSGRIRFESDGALRIGEVEAEAPPPGPYASRGSGANGRC